MQISHCLRRLVAALLPIALCAGLQPVAAAERTQAANLVPIFAFGSPPDGATDVPASVRSDLLLATDGNIYFAGSSGGKGFGAVGRLEQDNSVSVVHAFADADEGTLAFGGPIQATDGNLYGTTYFGGEGAGVVYKLTLAGEFTRLHAFGVSSSDAKFPYAGLVEAGDGNLYGTTRLGGANNKGTIYRVSTSGTFAVIHSFDGSGGQDPQGRLAVGSDGQLYGTTMLGGANNRGTIFRISTAGDFQLLYSFPRLSDFSPVGLATNSSGSNPKAGLLRTADGVFVGAAYQGGQHGWGTLFRATINGNAADVSVVHQFAGWPFDAGHPQSVPVLALDGNFYGTSEHGGYDSEGAVWKIAPDGSSSTLLHSFTASSQLATAGSLPIASVLFANGSLYGATSSDGATGAGFLYRLELDQAGALPIDFTVSDKDVLLDEPVTISWNAPAAVTCDKFGSWNEPVSEDDPAFITPTTGTETVTPFVDTVYTYGLACKDAADVVRYAYAAIDVRAPPQEPTDGGKIIGGGALSWLLLALLVALLFVKLFKETRRSCP